MSSNSSNKYLFPLIIMASLFFLFGFITTMNNSMIDFLKDAFGLTSKTLKQLPNIFFYGMYVFSIPISLLINRIGYKNGVLSGLGVVALGFFLCIPLVAMGYVPFLVGVGVFAVGVVILQVAANPYVNALGAPETAASRLTLTNFLNSVATVIAPIFVSMLMVSGTGSNDPKAVQFPFGLIGFITIAILGIMFFLKLPEIKGDEDDIAGGEKKKYKSSAFKYPHVWLGSLAIFVYMGIEIGIPSFFADYSEKIGVELTAKDKTTMLSFYWGGLMVGRALGIFILQKFKASQILSICAIGGAALVAASLAVSGNMGTIALWLFLGTGLFHSIMWPVIYNLGLEDLGPNAKVASGIIATSVIGAGILTLLMGQLQDITGTVIAAIACLFVYYAYLFFFATKGSKIRTA